MVGFIAEIKFITSVRVFVSVDTDFVLSPATIQTPEQLFLRE